MLNAAQSCCTGVALATYLQEGIPGKTFSSGLGEQLIALGRRNARVSTSSHPPLVCLAASSWLDPAPLPWCGVVVSVAVPGSALLALERKGLLKTHSLATNAQLFSKLFLSLKGVILTSSSPFSSPPEVCRAAGERGSCCRRDLVMQLLAPGSPCSRTAGYVPQTPLLAHQEQMGRAAIPLCWVVPSGRVSAEAPVHPLLLFLQVAARFTLGSGHS